MSLDPLFDTENLIVPQYILLALFSWLAINSIQQGKTISRALGKLDIHLEQSKQDKDRLSNLEEKIIDTQKEQQTMFKEILHGRVFNDKA